VTRSELTGRLKVMGMKRDEFAAMLGVSIHTTYHWKEVPVYAVVIVGLLEKIKVQEERWNSRSGSKP
jgi:hypothetical protein